LVKDVGNCKPQTTVTFVRPVKQPVSLRLNPDILHWFEGRGRGWQTKIDRALQDHMERNG
jgi:uncharacterized protein (DUF4415 family)